MADSASRGGRAWWGRRAGDGVGGGFLPLASWLADPPRVIVESACSCGRCCLRWSLLAARVVRRIDQRPVSCVLYATFWALGCGSSVRPCSGSSDLLAYEAGEAETGIQGTGRQEAS